uniref:Uncharacterized protein n=1 Tax=Sphaerodactylus townsendi TaxID=933632 RepID=A0ACB8EWB7_9SAUR
MAQNEDKEHIPKLWVSEEVDIKICPDDEVMEEGTEFLADASLLKSTAQNLQSVCKSQEKPKVELSSLFAGRNRRVLEKRQLYQDLVKLSRMEQKDLQETEEWERFGEAEGAVVGSQEEDLPKSVLDDEEEMEELFLEAPLSPEQIGMLSESEGSPARQPRDQESGNIREPQAGG